MPYWKRLFCFLFADWKLLSISDFLQYNIVIDIDQMWKKLICQTELPILNFFVWKSKFEIEWNQSWDLWPRNCFLRIFHYFACIMTMKFPIQVTKFTYSGSSEEESAAIRMRFPTKIPVSIPFQGFFPHAQRFLWERNFIKSLKCWYGELLKYNSNNKHLNGKL